MLHWVWKRLQHPGTWALVAAGLLCMGSAAQAANNSVFRANSLQPHLAGKTWKPLRRALRWRRCTSAEKHYKKLRKKMSRSVSQASQLLIGRCWSSRRNYSQARQWMKPLTRRSYLLWDYVWVWIGDTYKSEKKIKQAVKAYLKVPSSSILYREARRRSASMLLNQNKNAQALLSVQRMPGWAARSAHWWIAVQAAFALNTKKGKAEAIRWATKLWVRSPNSDEAKQLKTWLRRRRITLELSSSQRIARAFLQNRRYHYKKALHTLKGLKLSRKAPRSKRCRLNFARGFAYFRRRWYRSATPHLMKARKTCQGYKWHVRTLFYLGLAYQRRGKWPKGVRYFNELTRRYPRHRLADDAVFRNADNADRSGKKALAKKYYKKLLRYFSGGDMSRTASWRLAYQAYKYGKWEKAVGLLTRFYRRYRRYKYAPAALYYAARAQAIAGQRQRGNRKKVIQMYERLLRKYPLHYYSFLALSQLRLYTGKRWRIRRCRWRNVKGKLHCVPRKIRKKRWFNILPWGPIPEQPPTDMQLAQLYDGVPAPYLDNPHYLRGLELLRLGLKSDAGAEWYRLRYCRTFNPKSKKRFCGRRKDPGAELLALLFHLAEVYYPANMTFRGRGIIAGRYPIQRSTLRTWYLSYSRPFWPIVEASTQRDKVHPAIAYAIMREESAFQEGVLSSSNAYGLMQLLVSTARNEAKSLEWKRKLKPSDLFLAKHNISLGVHHLRRLANTFKSQIPLIAGAYNAGAHRVRRWLRWYGKSPYDKWVESIGIKQTRHYARRVSQSYSIYRLLYVPANKRYWDRVPFHPNRPPLKEN